METAIVFGKVGSGKSTLCNMLCYREPSPSYGFKTSDGFRGMTTTVSIGSGNGWTAVDTVGVGETREGTVSTDEAKEVLKKFLKQTRIAYNYIFYVVRKGRFSEEEQAHWKAFKKIFKGAESNFVVVYTHATQQWIDRMRLDLKQAYGENTKIIGVSFPPIGEDRGDEDERRKIREASLKRLEETLKWDMWKS